MATTDDLRTVTLHGQPVPFRSAGSGPVLLLIHGIAGSSRTWDDVIGGLAESFTVVAPDLLGHGASAKPRGDYSLGAYASGIRDLLSVLGHERVTVVGHSLGGGIAMQLAYQFPELAERLVLVASGGLGPEVSPLLRAAALPGSELVLPVVTASPLRAAANAAAGFLARLGVRTGADIEEGLQHWNSLFDGPSRAAFLATLRSAVDVRGQRVSAVDRLYLTEGLPTLFVWGDRDAVIPIVHGRAAAAQLPHSRLVEFEDVGHFPHRAQPRRFVQVLTDFVMDTPVTEGVRASFGELLRAGPAR